MGHRDTDRVRRGGETEELRIPVVATRGLDDEWHRRFLYLAEHVGSWSKDPSTKVGAVVVRDRQVVGMGYNGFPRGVKDLHERYEDRPTKYALVVHAEANAILQAGERARGATIYVTPSFAIPCLCENCAKLVVQSGISLCVGWLPERTERSDRWADSLDNARTICDEAGVRYFGLAK